MRACLPVLTRALVLPALLAVLVAGLLASPAQAQRVTPDFFGLHAFHWQAPFTPSVEVGSANFTTSMTYWKDIDKRRGRFDFTRLDQQVEGAEAVGAQPMMALGRTPKFYSARPRAEDFDTYAPPMKKWRAWVAKVVGRFEARLDYQIWPEPNIIQNWKGTPAQLASLTAAAAKIIGNVAPAATVVGPAMTLRLKTQRTAMLKYYKQSVDGRRVHRYLDAIAIDTFPHLTGTPEDAYRLALQAKRLLARAGVRGVPFWNNEINYGVAGGGNPTGTTYPVKLQQSFVVRSYLLGAAAQMARTYWLGWFSTETMGVQMADAEGNQLPPGRSYGVVRGWMLGSSFQGCTTLSSGVWTCTMVSGNEVRRVYWRPTGSAMVTLPSTRTRLETQDGAVVVAPPSSVRVDHAPVMVASLR